MPNKAGIIEPIEQGTTDRADAQKEKEMKAANAIKGMKKLGFEQGENGWFSNGSHKAKAHFQDGDLLFFAVYRDGAEDDVMTDYNAAIFCKTMPQVALAIQ